MASKKSDSFVKLGDALKLFEVEEDKYISREFQKYGYDMAVELDDLKHKALYIKLAKEEPRALLEAAKRYVKDADQAKNKGAMFMWKLKQLKTAKTDKQEEPK